MDSAFVRGPRGWDIEKAEVVLFTTTFLGLDLAFYNFPVKMKRLYKTSISIYLLSYGHLS